MSKIINPKTDLNFFLLNFFLDQFLVLNQNQNKSTCYLFRFLWVCILIRPAIGRSMSVTRQCSAMLPKITPGYPREIIPFIENYATCLTCLKIADHIHYTYACGIR